MRAKISFPMMENLIRNITLLLHSKLCILIHYLSGDFRKPVFNLYLYYLRKISTVCNSHGTCNEARMDCGVNPVWFQDYLNNLTYLEKLFSQNG